MTVTDVAKMLCAARSSVGRWINWFTLHSVEGLKSLRPGCAPQWPVYVAVTGTGKSVYECRLANLEQIPIGIGSKLVMFLTTHFIISAINISLFIRKNSAYKI